MIKTRKIKIFLAFTLLTFLFGGFSSNMVAGQVDPISDMQKKLNGISEEKRKIIENLFILVQEVEEMKGEEVAAAQEIVAIKQEVAEIEKRITNEETTYENKRDILKRVLRSYQRRGPGSFLEIVLDSDNLTVFIQRLNALRDLTRNTGKLLDSLEESKEKLAEEKRDLAEKLVLMEKKQESLRQVLAKELQIKEEQEKYLASLEEESAFYREHLADLESSWQELKTLFPQITREISRIIAEGDFPADAIKVTFSLSGIKGTLEEKTFNEIIADNSSLAELVLNFTPGRAEIKFPQQELVLTGDFIVLEKHSLKFVAKEGSFYGLPLESGAINDLFRENDLLFNFQSSLAGSILDSIEVREGYLEFKIIPALFQER
ncbi:MAG: hypothetical protein AAGU27_11420 [Dehalobacterium sp.]